MTTPTNRPTFAEALDVPGHIRTYAPMLVAFVVTWLADALDIILDEGASTQLVQAVQAVAFAVYYAVVRQLERRAPKAGALLGYASQPKYEQPQG